MVRQTKTAKEDGHSKRPQRKSVTTPHYLRSKTIGTSISYPMQILDVSENGMKLRGEAEQNLPFMENTLIEVSLPVRLGENLPEQVIQTLAKVVRLEDDDRAAKDYGIKLIFLEPGCHQLWKEAVTYLH